VEDDDLEEFYSVNHYQEGAEISEAYEKELEDFVKTIFFDCK